MLCHTILFSAKQKHCVGKAEKLYDIISTTI